MSPASSARARETQQVVFERAGLPLARARDRGGSRRDCGHFSQQRARASCAHTRAQTNRLLTRLLLVARIALSRRRHRDRLGLPPCARRAAIQLAGGERAPMRGRLRLLARAAKRLCFFLARARCKRCASTSVWCDAANDVCKRARLVLLAMARSALVCVAAKAAKKCPPSPQFENVRARTPQRSFFQGRAARHAASNASDSPTSVCRLCVSRTQASFSPPQQRRRSIVQASRASTFACSPRLTALRAFSNRPPRRTSSVLPPSPARHGRRRAQHQQRR